MKHPKETIENINLLMKSYEEFGIMTPLSAIALIHLLFVYVIQYPIWFIFYSKVK